MGEENKVDVTCKAYCKLMLHSSQYPSKDVIGVLLGWRQGNQISISDTIPLFHLNPLTPMMEVGLSLIEAFASLHEKLDIIGTYFSEAAEVQPTNISRIASLLSDRIEALSAAPAVIIRQSHKLLEDPSNHTLEAFLVKSTDKIRTKVELEVSPKSVERFNELIVETSAPVFVNDFDDHFDDVTKDWTNKKLNQLVE